MRKKLGLLEERIGYHFDEFHLLKNAMTHSSYANEKHLPKSECNERLEFLGDAVLEIVSSDFLFHDVYGDAGGTIDEDSVRAMVCEPTPGVLCASRSIWESICYLAKARMQPEEESEIL